MLNCDGFRCSETPARMSAGSLSRENRLASSSRRCHAGSGCGVPGTACGRCGAGRGFVHARAHPQRRQHPARVSRGSRTVLVQGARRQRARLQRRNLHPRCGVDPEATRPVGAEDRVDSRRRRRPPGRGGEGQDRHRVRHDDDQFVALRKGRLQPADLRRRRECAQRGGVEARAFRRPGLAQDCVYPRHDHRAGAEAPARSHRREGRPGSGQGQLAKGLRC